MNPPAVRKDPLTGLAIEFVPAEGDPVPGGIGPAAPNSVRDEAVRIVDQRHGYTVEHAPDPEAHRAEYDEEERRRSIPNRADGWQVARDALIAACGETHYNANYATDRADGILKVLREAGVELHVTRNRVIDPDTVHLAGDLMPKCMVMLLPAVLRLLDEEQRA
jgi:hypothetical protein